MSGEKKIFVGVDLGSSRTKVAVINEEKKLLGYAVMKSGTDYSSSARTCLDKALVMAGAGFKEISRIISSGYGRRNISFSNDTKTEISCHAKGCYYYYPEASTIIDIGSQDNKIIKIDQEGKRLSFKMNRKCAAGTGAFLEEIAFMLDIKLNSLNKLALLSTETVELGSYCTVFSKTEVLERIKEGNKLPDIVKALFKSVIRRVTEMDSFNEKVVITGGVVAYNLFLAKMLSDYIGRKVFVPENPQFTGALGAALFASENSGLKISNEVNEVLN